MLVEKCISVTRRPTRRRPSTAKAASLGRSRRGWEGGHEWAGCRRGVGNFTPRAHTRSAGVCGVVPCGRPRQPGRTCLLPIRPVAPDAQELTPRLTRARPRPSCGRARSPSTIISRTPSTASARRPRRSTLSTAAIASARSSCTSEPAAGWGRVASVCHHRILRVAKAALGSDTRVLRLHGMTRAGPRLALLTLVRRGLWLEPFRLRTL